MSDSRAHSYHYMLRFSTITPHSPSVFLPAAVFRATVKLKFGRRDAKALCERQWEIEELHTALFRETISCIKPDCVAVGQTQAQERGEKACKMEAGGSRGVGAPHTVAPLLYSLL